MLSYSEVFRFAHRFKVSLIGMEEFPAPVFPECVASAVLLNRGPKDISRIIASNHHRLKWQSAARFCFLGRRHQATIALQNGVPQVLGKPYSTFDDFFAALHDVLCNIDSLVNDLLGLLNQRSDILLEILRQMLSAQADVK